MKSVVVKVAMFHAGQETQSPAVIDTSIVC